MARIDTLGIEMHALALTDGSLESEDYLSLTRTYADNENGNSTNRLLHRLHQISNSSASMMDDESDSESDERPHQTLAATSASPMCRTRGEDAPDKVFHPFVPSSVERVFLPNEANRQQVAGMAYALQQAYGMIQKQDSASTTVHEILTREMNCCMVMDGQSVHATCGSFLFRNTPVAFLNVYRQVISAYVLNMRIVYALLVRTDTYPHPGTIVKRLKSLALPMDPTPYHRRDPARDNKSPMQLVLNDTFHSTAVESITRLHLLQPGQDSSHLTSDAYLMRLDLRVHNPINASEKLKVIHAKQQLLLSTQKQADHNAQNTSTLWNDVGLSRFTSARQEELRSALRESGYSTVLDASVDPHLQSRKAHILPDRQKRNPLHDDDYGNRPVTASALEQVLTRRQCIFFLYVSFVCLS
jgi:hypothetical protein